MDLCDNINTFLYFLLYTDVGDNFEIWTHNFDL